MKLTEQEIRRFLLRIMVANDSFDGLESQLKELFTACKSQEEHELISHIIEKMTIVKDYGLSHLLENMSIFIKKRIELLGRYCVVAAAWDEDADSSQAVIQHLKPHLLGSGDVKFFNSVPEYVKKNRISDYPNFTLIDEFSGTGNTIVNRIKYIRNHAKSINVDITPSVFMLAGMSPALGLIRNEVSDSEFAIDLKPGISGYFAGTQRDNHILSMKRMEEDLSPEVAGHALPSLGYGGAEAMYCIKKWNAPNSNFPILWWPKDNNHLDRNTIFKRFRP